MRIIVGTHRGRKLHFPNHSGTRPMADRVREAVFNQLAHNFMKDDGTSVLIDSYVLDPFAGSGAVALEALSRGAKKAVVIEIARDPLKILKENICSLKEDERTKIIHGNALHPPKAHEPVDIVFLCPPYRKNFVLPVYKSLLEKEWLQEGTFVIIEVANDEEINFPKTLEICDERVYGLAKVYICKHMHLE